ncbi:N-6 DNA methylase [Bifidobacterium sp. ESL0790]|uniref:N-6 DNA methylase n=1 Tax=Bifidobacterium sp. ESL0790 TaxID=2983233 RepID=UPI0023F9325B|nr:N-6 DNA methylase [Bifidobacterium sp. ESL0790]WEV73048.1 N-6 DNA methylase [Bifidobacterium sp. ESL0790]
MSVEDYGIRFDGAGNILDVLSGKSLSNTPEERVRQQFISTLIDDYGYPKNHIRREVGIQQGSSLRKDDDGNPIRADIVVYSSSSACATQDQGNINFVVECKRRNVKEGYAQLISYLFNTSANGGVWTNGDEIAYYRRVNGKANQNLKEVAFLPRFGQAWDEDRVPKLGELKKPQNVRRLFAICHNKLYGRGMENADADLTMDMVRILLAKIQDETETSQEAYPQFWVTNKQYDSQEGRAIVAARVRKMFRDYADHYPTVFDSTETISVGDDTLIEAVSVLQEYSFISGEADADDWDLMGAAYEQFTHVTLKRSQGQFFTNRLVVKSMVQMLNPKIGDIALDPAGGSGGFATEVFRHLRRRAIEATTESSAQRSRQIGEAKNSVFLVEISPRLVKIAKTAMILTGDGNTGMTKGNSLDSYNRFDGWITSHCPKGTPNVIVTNPPFSGQKRESMITDREILRQFSFGHGLRHGENGELEFRLPGEDEDVLPRQAPELLFLERCIDWLKPGGRIGIVLPKGVLDNQTYIPYRRWVLERCRLDGVVTLHKNTFQPDTGVRTCILFLSKPGISSDGSVERIPDDYTIFMAQSRRIGKDSKGEPVYALDERGHATSDLDEDLSQIAERYLQLKNEGKFNESELCFTTKRSQLDANLNINPQHYSPRLNQILDRVNEFDNIEGWSVTTIGQLDKNIEIYMGPRWKSSNLVVENPLSTKGYTAYLTARAALEQRRMTIKWLDESHASKTQKAYIQSLKVKQGDILITRSGTIGNVTYATEQLADHYVISDDLIRVRVPDEDMRAYLLTFLMSSTAMSLMKLDEFGSVQQHLQPRHIWGLPVPLPDSWDQVKKLVREGKNMMSVMEKSADVDADFRQHGFDSLMRSKSLIPK